MTSAPKVGWLARTFGWSGSRDQWLALAGGLVWFAGLLGIAYFARNWTIGQALLAFSAWVFVLGLVARDALRDLFGPVFFYDLLRVSRSRFTFIIRGFYVIAIGAFLGLKYYAWMLDNTRKEYDAGGELATFGVVAALIVGFGLFFAARGKWHYAVRAVVLVLGVILASILTVVAIGYFSTAVRYTGPTMDTLPTSVISRFATSFFEHFVVLQFIVMTLLTPVYVAATIAVEKERKTLEFLLATDLRNREIVFGKLASRVLTLVMYVLAGLPLLAFLQLFGGIDPEQLLAATTATLTMVLGLSALSIWVSTTLRRARDAIFITYLLAIAYGFVSFLLAVLPIVPGAGTGWWNTPIVLFGYSLAISDITGFFADGNPIWAMFKLENGRRVGMITGVSGVLREFVVFWGLAIVLFLFSAILKVRRVALDQAYGSVGSRRAAVHPKAPGAKKPLRRPVETSNPVILLIDGTDRRPPLNGNPVTWKEVFVDSTFRTGCLGRMVAILILILTLAPFFFITYYEFLDPLRYQGYIRTFGEQWDRYTQNVNGWIRVVTGVLGVLMFFSAAIRGAGAISGEKDRDTWLSLTSTPLSTDEILAGKFWGCVFGLRRAFCVLLLIWTIGLVTGSIMPWMMPVMLLLTAVYVSVFSLVGIFCSITARTTLIASVRAFFAALFCAGGYWVMLGICCFLPMSLMRASYSTHDQFSSFFLGFLPPLVYGIFPLRDFERNDIGPFYDSDHSVGIIAPIAGTIFWIVFSLVMLMICRSKLSEITNRSPNRRPQRRPGEDRRDNSEIEGETRDDPS